LFDLICCRHICRQLFCPAGIFNFLPLPGAFDRAVFCRRKSTAAIILLFVFSFSFGLFRYEISYPDFSDRGKVYYYNETKAEFYGQVSKVEIADSQKITIKADSLSRDKTYLPVSGKVLITQSLYPEYRPGDRLKVKCEL